MECVARSLCLLVLAALVGWAGWAYTAPMLPVPAPPAAPVLAGDRGVLLTVVEPSPSAVSILTAACRVNTTSPRPLCLTPFTARCSHLYTSALVGLAATALTPADLGALAACGLTRVRVHPDGKTALPRSADGSKPALRPPPRRSLLQLVTHGELPASRRGEEPFDSLAAGTATLDVPGEGSGPIRAAPASLWNLDVLDNRKGARDGSYRPDPATAGGAGVKIFHLDTGVFTNHREFGGRATVAADLTGGDGRDDDGHGTHTASTAVGALVGVAPAADLVSYRVLDGGGAGRVSALVAALDAIVATRRSAADRGSPLPGAVALMSLGTPAASKGPQHAADAEAVEAAVRALVATNVTVVAAAGNGGPGDDACDTLPAALGGEPESGVLAVAAADLVDKFEVGGGRRAMPPYPFSSTGRCVSLFAPGVDVVSACGATHRCSDPESGRSYTFASGSSMAAPHVAGAAALFLARNLTARPAEVVAFIKRGATAGAVKGGERGPRQLMLPGTTDGLLYVGQD